jgi:CRP-like cAMP-binding protein
MDLLDLFKYYEKIEDFSSGDIIFQEGEPGKTMYLVLKGLINIQVKGKSVAKIGPGDFFGEMSLIDARYRSATAMAMRDSQLVAVPENQFLRMVKKNPEFALYILKILVRRLRNMDEKILNTVTS